MKSLSALVGLFFSFGLAQPYLLQSVEPNSDPRYPYCFHLISTQRSFVMDTRSFQPSLHSLPSAGQVSQKIELELDPASRPSVRFNPPDFAASSIARPAVLSEAFIGFRPKVPLKHRLYRVSFDSTPPTTGAPTSILSTLQAPSEPRVGEKYVYLGDEGSKLEWADQALSLGQLFGRTLVLKHLQAKQGIFELEGKPLRFNRYGNTFPNLAPVIKDPGLSALRKRYGGQPIWGYGGLDLMCITDGITVWWKTLPATPGKILSIERVLWPSLIGLDGRALGVNGVIEGQNDLLTATPLIVRIQVENLYLFSSASAFQVGQPVGTDCVKGNPGVSRTEPATFTQIVADEWQLERLYSLSKPPQLPALSSPVPPNPINPIGLSKTEYAWMFGVPNAMYETLSEIMQTNTWVYTNSPPFHTTVLFKSGKVIKKVQPRLP